MVSSTVTQKGGTKAGRVTGLFALLLSCTVLQRFGLTFGSVSLSLALLAMYAVLVLALFSRRLEVAPQRLTAYGLCVFAAIASAMVNGNFAAANDDTSLTSLVLMFAIYLPLVFRINTPASSTASGHTPLDTFGDIAFFCAITGIAQFYAQFVFHPDWLFDYSPYIPNFLRASGEFNTVIAADEQHKANGFFFREPSGYSYIMALGLIIEWLGARRLPRLGVLVLALLLSYSGTGILTLLIAMLFPLGARTLSRLTLLALVGAAGYWMFGDVLDLSFTLNRVYEFGSEGSSAYLRYVAPMRFVSENLESTPWSLWVGHGPGAISRASQLAYAFHDPTWAKLVYEYGVLGFAAFLLLTIAMLRRSCIPLRIRAVILGHWLAMGGYLLKPECIAVTFAFFALYPAQTKASVNAQTEELPVSTYTSWLRKPLRRFT